MRLEASFSANNGVLSLFALGGKHRSGGCSPKQLDGKGQRIQQVITVYGVAQIDG
jgi:hypothetical protein